MGSKRKRGGRAAKQGRSSYDYDHGYGYDPDDDDWGAWGSGGGGGGGDSDSVEELPFTRLNYDSYNHLTQCVGRVIRRDMDMASKVDRFARKAWQSTLKSCNAASGGLMPKRVETFVHDWIEDTLGRCWQSIICSFEEPSRLTGTMAAEVFTLMSRKMNIIGTDNAWQISPTSRVVERAVRQTWPQYFPKVPCDIDDWNSKSGGSDRAERGAEREDRAEKGGPPRSKLRLRSDRDDYAQAAQTSGVRGGWKQHGAARGGGDDQRGPLENPLNLKAGRRWVDRSRTPPSSSGRGGDARPARRVSRRSPSLGSSQRQGSDSKGQVRLSLRRSAADGAKGDLESARGRLDEDRSRSKSSVKLTEKPPPPRLEVRQSEDDAAQTATKRMAVKSELGKAAKAADGRAFEGGQQRSKAVAAAAAEKGSKQAAEEKGASKQASPSDSKVTTKQAQPQPQARAPESPEEAAPAPDEDAKLDEGGEEARGAADDDEDDEDDEQDDDALRALMAQAMEAAAASGAQPPEGGAGVAEDAKATPENFTVVSVEQALRILETSAAPSGVSGCSSTEACAGSSCRDGLQRFEGFDDHVYCTSCCKMLQRQYPALKNAQLLQAH